MDILTIALVALIAIVVIGTVGRAILMKKNPSWGHKRPTPGGTGTSFWQGFQKLPWPKKIRWGWIILIILCLPIIWPIVRFIGLVWIAGMDYNTRGTHLSEYSIFPKTASIQRIPALPPRNENRNRDLFFVDTPRKLGWKVLPTEVDFDIPLDGVPRYLGLNTVFLAGSRLTIDCPGYFSGGKVKLFAKGDDEKFTHLGNHNAFSLRESGSVTGGGAILVKGEKARGYQALSNRIHAEVKPLPGHHRIATTKTCETGMAIAYDWGTTQIGTRNDSPQWQVYVRFADVNGITLTPSVMQQKPGQVTFMVKGDKGWRQIFTEIVSKPANLYGSYNVPAGEKDPMLRIQVPNLPEGKVIVEVILDIDNT